MIELQLNRDLMWSSDWNGDEVGYPDRLVVGLYIAKDTERNFYIDMETLEILEVWEDNEDEEKFDDATFIDPETYTVTY